MLADEKVAMLYALVDAEDGEKSYNLLNVYLRLAASKMLERLFPFDSTRTEKDIPDRYDTLQVELAARLFLRKGGEGEVSHEENGVNRTYASVDDEDILSRLTPFAKVGG